MFRVGHGKADHGLGNAFVAVGGINENIHEITESGLIRDQPGITDLLPFPYVSPND